MIRTATPEDREAWLRLRTALWPELPEEHPVEIQAYFDGSWQQPWTVLLAEVDSEVIGLAEVSIRSYAEGCTTRNVGYLEGWYVAPDHRHRGIALALLRAGEDWARAQGCTEFASDAAPENEASHRAHLACGFEDMGLVRCFRKML